MGFPVGRIGTSEFFTRTGISKTTFFERYRKDPAWIAQLDIRIDVRGRLTLDEAAVDELAAEMKGRPAFGHSDRAERVLEECPWCAEFIRPRARICRYCQREVGDEGSAAA